MYVKREPENKMNILSKNYIQFYLKNSIEKMENTDVFEYTFLYLNTFQYILQLLLLMFVFFAVFCFPSLNNI